MVIPKADFDKMGNNSLTKHGFSLVSLVSDDCFKSGPVTPVSLILKVAGKGELSGVTIVFEIN